LTPVQGRSPEAFLIWDIDGKRLSERDAPLRLILANGGEAGQLHGITTITLVDGAKLVNLLKAKEKP
jgi:hypothetical protein